VRERVHTILECRKLKDPSLYVKGDSDITRFHAKCRDLPQGRTLERGMVRDREWEKEREREIYEAREKENHSKRACERKIERRSERGRKRGGEREKERET